MSSQVPESVRSTMLALTDGLLIILGARLVSVYLGGSLPMGDFCEESSDLDFLVLTRGPLSMEDALAVELLHKDLRQKYPYAARLEGDYAPVEVIVPEGTTVPVPGCERGIFLPKVGEIMLSADNIANMREQGIPFYGPSPREVLPRVSPEQVRAAVRTMLTEGPGPCGTPGEEASELLNLLRSACALETGAPTSKSDGARWGFEHLEPRWRPAIEAAVSIRCGKGTAAQAAVLQEALGPLSRVIRSLGTHS